MKLSRAYSDLQNVWIDGRRVDKVRVRWFAERYPEKMLDQHVGRLSPAAQEEDYLTDDEIELIREEVQSDWSFVGDPIMIEEQFESSQHGHLERLCMQGRAPYRELWRRGHPCVTLIDRTPEARRGRPTFQTIRGLCEIAI